MKRRVSSSLIAIVAEGLFSRLSFGLISFSLPLYARHLGLSLTEVGILAAMNSAVAVALKPLLGWAADGFPVYGPWGYATAEDPSAIRVLMSSYRVKKGERPNEPRPPIGTSPAFR